MGLSTVLLSLAVGASAELADFRVSTPAGSLLYSFDCPSLKGDQFCAMTVRARVSRRFGAPFFGEAQRTSPQVYASESGDTPKCEMFETIRGPMTLAADGAGASIFSMPTLIDMPPSAAPTFPGATKLMAAVMRWDQATDELSYLVATQGVLPNYGLIPDWDAVALRNAGVVFARVPATSCGTTASAASAGSEL